jgi:hypothetical protein
MRARVTEFEDIHQLVNDPLDPRSLSQQNHADLRHDFVLYADLDAGDG